jgi:hypothetical protein
MTMIGSQIASAGIKDLKRVTAPYTQKGRLILILMCGILAALFVAGYFVWDDLSDQFKAPQRIEATKEQTKKSPIIEEQTNKDPVITGEELSRAMVAELWEASESESAQRAFNILAGFWNVSSVPESVNLNQFNEMERAALDRELRLYRFSGSLGVLLRIDYPAVLELTIPGMPGKRFISLVGMEKEQLLIDPPIAGRRSLSFSELEKHWSGQGLLIWKDPLNLLTNMSPGSKGNHIRRLQGLLREIEAYNGPLTGVYDSDTLSAVKKFQSSRGIEQDGIVGGQTLMVLYRSIDRFEVPSLTGGEK